MLSGATIAHLVKNRQGIEIEPFSEDNIGPNSYDLTLHNELLVYTMPILNLKEENPTRKIEIPKEGLILRPGELYLGKTVEYVKTSDQFVPMLEGRSSIGRLGIFIHTTAGFGDIGFCGNWTLEISVIKPVVIYPFIKICQIFFHPLSHSAPTPVKSYSGKYQNSKEIVPSRLYAEF